jgi:luciferase family oxidoreductase group 1
VLAAALAAKTQRMRIGAGGVMLPNHPPLVVAEQFGMLEALYPGRIDLGIGRAPGTDQITASALRRSAEPISDEDFPTQLMELVNFFKGEFSPRDPYRHVKAVPGNGDMPRIWLLGSSGYSAQLAGLLGLPFSFAHHFMPRNTDAALELYRTHFQPSEYLTEPYAMVACAALAAADDEHARYLSGPARLSMSRLRAGRPTRFPTPEEAAAHEFTAGEEHSISALSGSAAIGSADTVRAKLDSLAERTAADELMITTMVHDHGDRIRSYELIANSYELAGTDAVGAGQTMEER